MVAQPEENARIPIPAQSNNSFFIELPFVVATISHGWFIHNCGQQGLALCGGYVNINARLGVDDKLFSLVLGTN